MVVSVTDQGGPDEPAAVVAADLDESGRGLQTISLTAASWGRHGNGDGRTVTAVFAGEWVRHHGSTRGSTGASTR